MSKLYSVIIPHYNSIELLLRCLQSIPQRDDIQIIVIDDFSPADVYTQLLSKCNRLANLEIYRNERNSGAGYSRNLGISKACGKWLLFADCDDSFTEDAFKIFDDYSDSDNDLIYFDSEIINTTNARKHQGSNTRNIELYLSGKNKKLIRTTNWEPWGKLFSNQFAKLNNIYFHECKVMNDAFFSVKFGMLAKLVTADSRKVYKYYIYDNSISRQLSVEKDLTRINEIIQINKFILSKKGFRFYTIDLMFVFVKYIRKWGINNFNYVLSLIKHEKKFIGIPFYSILGKIRRNIRK